MQVATNIEDLFVPGSYELKQEPSSGPPKDFTSRVFFSVDYDCDEEIKVFFNGKGVYKIPRITLTDETFEHICAKVFTARVQTTNTCHVLLKPVYGSLLFEIKGVGSFGSKIQLWQGERNDIINFMKKETEGTDDNTNN